jgi:hypothetical protein
VDAVEITAPGAIPYYYRALFNSILRIDSLATIAKHVTRSNSAAE